METQVKELTNSTQAQPFWRTDTKSLVGAIFLGIAFILVQQIAHRIDLVLWPTLVIIGGITWATFTGLISLTFQQPAGLIMAETQAVFAVATGLSPFAVFFIPANGLGSLAYSLVAHQLSMKKWQHHLLAQLVTNVVGNLCVGIGLYTILKLPIPIVLISSTITTLASTIGATIATKQIYESLQKSGVIL